MDNYTQLPYPHYLLQQSQINEIQLRQHQTLDQIRRDQQSQLDQLSNQVAQSQVQLRDQIYRQTDQQSQLDQLSNQVAQSQVQLQNLRNQVYRQVVPIQNQRAHDNGDSLLNEFFNDELYQEHLKKMQD